MADFDSVSECEMYTLYYNKMLHFMDTAIILVLSVMPVMVYKRKITQFTGHYREKTKGLLYRE